MPRNFLVFMVVIIILLTGCSAGEQSPAAPDNQILPALSGDVSNHSPLGFWQMVANPQAGTIDVIPMRMTELHLNALQYLEPPPNLYLTIESPPQFSGGTVEVDIGLRHPFLGMTQYTGFDVCGILISSGSMSGYSDADIVIPGPGDTHLKNADGLTRWWNPDEFPYNVGSPGQGYIDGALGTPDSSANFNATLNGFKYFSDNLDSTSAPDTIPADSRGYFSAGGKNVRHYVISLAGGLIFNYAVDATWASTGLPPYQIDVPDSFPPNANRPEPFYVRTDVLENTLFYDQGDYGGSLSLDVYVYDWFDAGLDNVIAECPGVFAPVSSSTPAGGGENYSVYHIDLTNPTLGSTDDLLILVGAESQANGYQGKLPGKPVTGYAPLLAVTVDNTAPTGVVLIAHDEGLADSDEVVGSPDIEPALTITASGELRLVHFWVKQLDPTNWSNAPRYNTSSDYGLTFGPVEYPQWIYHNVSPDEVRCFNSKLTVASDGQGYWSYDSPAGHTNQRIPKAGDYLDSTVHSGTGIGHAGEMLYTIDGYPMMFGDAGGVVKMRRGDVPFVAGTGTWPTYGGTEYVLSDAGWLSLVRSTGMTSDGICHLVYWRDGVDAPIRMLSSDDTSGTSWTVESIIESGAAELWVGAHDPSLWVDKNDNFHVAYAGDTWMNSARLLYAFSDDGINWSGTLLDNAIEFTDLELHDTGVVTFDAFGEQYIFLCYEYGGDVFFQYKKTASVGSYSAPEKVNVHPNANIPDIYPNGATGVVFAYEADGDNGNTDVFYRMYEFVEQ